MTQCVWPALCRPVLLLALFRGFCGYGLFGPQRYMEVLGQALYVDGLENTPAADPQLGLFYGPCDIRVLNPIRLHAK
jgi:hypothetical protein